MIGSTTRSPLDTACLMLDSLRDRSLDGVLDCFDEGPDAYIFVEGPRWTNRDGKRIHQGWRDYFNAPITLLSWRWTDGPDVFESGDLGLVCGVVEYQFEGAGTPRTLLMRMTWGVRRSQDRVYRIVHEHGSQPLEDPYGTGDWLVKNPTADDVSRPNASPQSAEGRDGLATVDRDQEVPGCGACS